MNRNEKIFTVFLIIIALVSIGILAYGFVYEKAYNECFETAQYSIAHQISNTGNIPVYDPNNETIIWYNINQICGR
ncbi:MAG TPA: hypothetical protein VMZ91_03495 [Candidatus Paceibacterota bacterium]|nr:hypothetical protein [Candidatus Paceibacterota bacterium]